MRHITTRLFVSVPWGALAILGLAIAQPGNAFAQGEASGSAQPEPQAEEVVANPSPEEKAVMAVALLAPAPGGPNPKPAMAMLKAELLDNYILLMPPKLRAELVSKGRPAVQVRKKGGALAAAKSLGAKYLLALKGIKGLNVVAILLDTQTGEPVARKPFKMKSRAVPPRAGLRIATWVVENVPASEPPPPVVEAAEEPVAEAEEAPAEEEDATIALDLNAQSEEENSEESAEETEQSDAELENKDSEVTNASRPAREKGEVPALRVHLGVGSMQRDGCVSASDSTIDCLASITNNFAPNYFLNFEIYPFAFNPASSVGLAGVGAYLEGQYGRYLTSAAGAGEDDAEVSHTWTGRTGLTYRYPIKEGGIALRVGAKNTHFPTADLVYPTNRYFMWETGVRAEIPVMPKTLALIAEGHVVPSFGNSASPLLNVEGRRDLGEIDTGLDYEAGFGVQVTQGKIEGRLIGRYGVFDANFIGQSSYRSDAAVTDPSLRETSIRILGTVGIRL